MARKDDRTTLRAGDIHEPESIVRDDYSRSTFAEMEMKLQGTKAYEYNARRTLVKAASVKKEEYKDKSSHHFVWYKQIYLPVLKLRSSPKRPSGKSNNKDFSILTMILTFAVVALTSYIASNWESIRPAIVAKSDKYAQELVFHERGDSDFASGAECVGAFLAYVAEEDAPNAIRCLDTYAGTSYFRCETMTTDYVSRVSGATEGSFARSFLQDLVAAYDNGSDDIDLSRRITDYGYRCTPSLVGGRECISVTMDITTTQESGRLKLKIPTVTYSGNYYINYERLIEEGK